MPPAPERPIRRFDVFAEYRKQEHQEQGVPEDEAKGYGLWVAKVVAARRFRRGRGPDGQLSGGRPEPERRGKRHELDGQPQTDALFDAEIVTRMGQEFYREVFVPAIQQARARGRSYEAIRDAIRRPWRPPAGDTHARRGAGR
jgi:hypothetical protein